MKISRVRCKICGDILESLYTHDFKECTCGKTIIDGGNDYLRTTIYAEVLK